MIDLYGMSSPNVLKAVLMLEEIGLPYQFKHVNMIAGDQYAETFRAINPNGRAPAIVDHDGPGGAPFAVFESGAILLYLAEKTGQFWPENMRRRHTMLQWLMFQMGGIGPMSGQFVHFTRAAPAEGNDYARARYATETRRLYGVLDRRLAESRYMARMHEMLKLDFADFPHLARWVDEIAARPAAHRTVVVEGEIRPLDGAAFQAATPDQIDRFFARGKYSAV
jgi:GST-like protein